jgi:hypothetical protein
MDAILEVNAPFYGDILTLNEPLACYRMHDSNLAAQTKLDLARSERLIENFDQKLLYLADRCRLWGIAFDPHAARERSLWCLEYRLAVAKLSAANEPGTEPLLRVLTAALRACARSPFSLRQKLFRGLWITAVVLLPRALAVRLIEARFVVARRPVWLERLFGHRPRSIGFSTRP